MTSRTIKWTTLLILLCLTFFLGSFNATMRILVDQRKESNAYLKKSLQSNMPNQPYSETSNSNSISTINGASGAFQKIAQQQVQYTELKNPTRKKYKSFSRQLDEFSEKPKSYKRQDHYQSTPHTNSTHTLADAHFAKALRMVSSSFDRVQNGGNALPEEVYGGGYRQENRGDKFVKMNWPKRVKRSRRPTADNEEKHILFSFFAGNVSDWYLNALDILQKWSYDAINNFYDILGVDIEARDPGNEGIDDVDVTSSSYYPSRNEEDIFSWIDTRVGRQLIRIYEKTVRLWSRHHRSEYETGSVSSNDETTTKELLSKEDHISLEGLFHLEKAAELGHAEAQRMVANSLASGILPLSDHSLIQRYAHWQHINSDHGTNSTALLTNAILQVPDDFSSGGEQLSRAIVLWHLSAMDGNVESAMALGFRHLYSATGGTTRLIESQEEHISPGYSYVDGGSTDAHGTSPTFHYGVLGTCPTALAYYEAAANGVMDELESGPTKGKVAPPMEEHRLAQIHMRGGASVVLEHHNKPDEIEEALQYYRMLASRNRSPEPDLSAAFTIANFYHLGIRGVKQDLRLALKYYEICGDHNHWEGGGLAGLFHVWGIGMTPEERDLGKAFSYFTQGTPGGIDGCSNRLKKKKVKDKNADELYNCDRHSANGMGLISLLGIDGLVDRNVANARLWFEIAKDLGDSDGQFNYAMLRLGWMVTEVYEDHYPVHAMGQMQHFFDHENPTNTPERLNYLVYRRQNSSNDIKGPTAADYTIAFQELSRAASKGHIQAKHKLAMLWATGVEVQTSNGKLTSAVKQSCIQALHYYKDVAESGHTISKRNRAAWKQYNNGDYESSLRNYLATAETGSVVGQMNAAFLLERGHCLGMAPDACIRASVRLWRVAARQGSLESCLRVGDFYYYGRMKKSPVILSDGKKEELTDDEFALHVKSLNRAFYYVPGPYRWARYLLYPEEAVSITINWLARSIKKVTAKFTSSNGLGTKEKIQMDSSCVSNLDPSDTCSSHRDKNSDSEDHEHMTIAAQYYRKAAEDHKSARANFNLGFMYEWGLGLNQDFPLAKRHYDLAGEEADFAASIALFSMRIHEKLLKSWVYLSTIYLDND